MRPRHRRNRGWPSPGAVVAPWLLAAAVLLVPAMPARAQGQASSSEPQPTLEIYGFGQADAIADFDQTDPKWFDVMRPSRLPSSARQFGEDGHFYLSARQSRFGARGELPTDSGPVKAVFEFDMFGVGADAGQTTIRLRHAWGQWRQIGAGQTNSVFMDVDTFPNSLDYWGPNGMLFFRNVQVFWRPVDGDTRVSVSVENPGASGDAGVYADRVELQNIVPRFPMPDIAAEYRRAGSRGHFKTSGMLRRLSYDDVLADQFDLSGSVTGWGLNFSGSIKAGSSDTIRLQYVIGEGIQNYFNDAPVDLAAETNPGNLVTPLVGKALPIQGFVAFLDHNWSSRLSTAVGYSRVDIDNTDAQAPNAFKAGQYALVNLLSTPARNVMMGGELQWFDRENNSDGFSVSDLRLQFSFKYSFALKVGG